MLNLNLRHVIQKNLKYRGTRGLCKVFLPILLVCYAENVVSSVGVFSPKMTVGVDSTANLAPFIESFFSNYSPSCKSILPMGVDSYTVNEQEQRIDIYVTEGVASQVFTEEMVNDIYSRLSNCLPFPYRDYKICIYGHNIELSRLVPSMYATHVDTLRLWNGISYCGNEWVCNMSRPYDISRGLQKTHLTVWPSHGRYFDYVKNEWVWQRPSLYCTTEDLFTRSIVVPFLVPMLENAGAVVYMPCERDEGAIEIIVDNDDKNVCQKGTYREFAGQNPFDSCNVAGFCQVRKEYVPGQNPHTEGTARMALTVTDSAKASVCEWIPDIPDDGNYALYVTYPSGANNVNDATYIVRHNNVDTRIRVNQQMGGGTWVYLGTFGFSKGCSPRNSVRLTNLSSSKGIVMADAIRIGGGKGNMMRNGKTSGLPRFLEGALYYAQWAGMPYYVYNTKDGRNDYADDINVRSNALNYVAGGSAYVPDTTGLCVPMELCLAVHSDAGFTTDNSVFGTLGIYTSAGDEGTQHFASGVSRLSSLDLAASLQNELCRDLTKSLGLKWTQRELYNRNYSETRKPEVSSTILETLSHQNFRDMLYGHDPNFKFLISRSIYKALVRYIAFQHQRECVIQPLPVRSFAVSCNGGEAVLSWRPQTDSLEPTALPTGYVVYTGKDGEDFDNGRFVGNGATSVSLPIDRDVVYRFKVTACNAGGESFPSETLSVLSASEEEQNILIVNGFTRLSGPDVVLTEQQQGFDIHSDIGVPYKGTSEYCGAQLGFMRSKAGLVGPGGLGYSGQELAGRFIAGNTFDYSYIHALAIKDKKHRYSVSSCSVSALADSLVMIGDYQLVDLLFGLQRDNGLSSYKHYKTFDAYLKAAVNDYINEGGKLLVSGAYVASDMNKADERLFTTETLCYSLDSCMVPPLSLTSDGRDFSIVKEWNPKFYATKSVDVLKPHGLAKPFVFYGNGACAAVATSNVVIMGFPLESIENRADRIHVMKKILQKLL